MSEYRLLRSMIMALQILTLSLGNPHKFQSCMVIGVDRMNGMSKVDPQGTELFCNSFVQSRTMLSRIMPGNGP